MSDVGEGIWRERAAKLFCAAVILLGSWLLLTYAKALLLVTLLVVGLSAAVDSLSRRTERVLRLPRKLCAVLYLVLLLLFLGLAVFWILHRLAEELADLMEWVEEHRSWIGEQIGALFESLERISERLPLPEHTEEGSALSRLGESIDSLVSNLIHESFLGIGELLSAGVGSVLRGTPRLLITSVVMVIACFYLSMDYEGIRDRLIEFLPPRLREGVHRGRKKAGVAVRNYLRAYLLLFLLTFFEVLVGLLILGRPYAFLLALVVALVDLLPILGAGTVLVPWAVVMLLLKNYYLGVGLLILFGVITIVRQIAEPHIVGGSLGLHPLVSLFFLFAGLQLFGFWGMILGPAIALILKEFLQTESTKKRP